MAFSDYGNYDGLGLAELVRAKKVSPAELVEEAIIRIETHNPALNAVVRSLYERALKPLQLNRLRSSSSHGPGKPGFLMR